MRLVNFAHGDYIAFCVFALLWPSIDAAAIVFIGNLPTVVLIPLVIAIGAGLSVLSEIAGVPPVAQRQSGDDDDRVLRAGLRHQDTSC